MIRHLACFLLVIFSATALHGAAPRFAEVGAAWGAEFRHHHCGSGKLYMTETMGSGVVIFDYDGDGDRDLFFVDSGVLPEGCPDGPPRSVLLRNDLSPSGPRFVDVTAASGIAASGIVVTAYGMGATAGDIDGDGDLDLFVSSFGPDQLFRNQGDGTFVDVTAAAGVGEAAWGASAAFADADLDGDLDLYVSRYVDFAYDNNPACGVKERGLRSYCHPDVYNGLSDTFYLNRGDGTFVDATEQAGFGGGGVLGKGLGVVWGDWNGDGRPDLYVANDMTPNFQFENQGFPAKLFEEIAMFSGTAVSDLGKEEASMGIAVGDVDGNGGEDLLVTHLDLQTNAFYSNLGGGMFSDHRFVARLAEPSLYKVGFGAVFADFDQDGDLDLAVADGHIIHNVEAWGTGTTYKQKNQFFDNLGDGRFAEVEDSGFEAVRSSRGLATGDLDGDGDLDLAVSNSNDVSEVYENRSPTPRAALEIDLRRATGDRFAIGARVEVAAGELRPSRQARTASSYLSQSDLTLHFGVGKATRIDEIVVHWPGGGVTKVRGAWPGRWRVGRR